ncbi:MAG TPA: DUF4136 domain-containing protein [Candidatus Deferrimicrobiaceae bacterium]|jgi:hypothetical protein|nr:DUF4136 domain-containing protein [Candidatus Deferrimicrobiaceae bacterium]
MKALRVFSSTLAVLLAFAAVALAQDVKTDYDHHANFSQYHTYYWEKVKTTDPLWENRIKDAVDHELQAKGWQRVDSGGDVAVMAVGSSRNQQEYQTFYDGLGGWRWGGFGETTTQVENYPVGSLVLDLYDARTKQLIWRGVSSEALSNNPEKNEKKLDKAVDKMLEHFPPHEKG